MAGLHEILARKIDENRWKGAWINDFKELCQKCGKEKCLSDNVLGCYNTYKEYHKELADGVRHFKEEGGRKLMCEAVEKYAEKKAIESTIEDAIFYGMSKAPILQRVIEKYGIDSKEAENLYNTYAKSIA